MAPPEVQAARRYDACLPENPVLHLKDPIRPARKLTIVRHKDHGQTLVGTDLKQQVVKSIARFRIQIPRRLVGEEEGRIIDQRPRNGHALLLPAGELPRAVIEAMAQPHSFKKPAGPSLGLARRQPGDPRGHRRILKRGKLPKQMMELEDKAHGPVAQSGECVA